MSRRQGRTEVARPPRVWRSTSTAQGDLPTWDLFVGFRQDCLNHHRGDHDRDEIRVQYHPRACHGNLPGSQGHRHCLHPGIGLRVVRGQVALPNGLCFVLRYWRCGRHRANRIGQQHHWPVWLEQLAADHGAHSGRQLDSVCQRKGFFEQQRHCLTLKAYCFFVLSRIPSQEYNHFLGWARFK